MADDKEELQEQLYKIQASQNTDPQTRQVVGHLNETIQLLGEQIEELQLRVKELEETSTEEEKRSWYSDRE